MVRNKRQRPYHNFKKADVFRKIPVLLALYQHKLHGSLGDTNDELMYDPDVSVQKQTCYNCIGVYFQALMKSPFMKEQPGYACITTSPERLRESFINIGFWAEGAPLPRLGSREVQDLADLAVFLGVQNASYEMFGEFAMAQCRKISSCCDFWLL